MSELYFKWRENKAQYQTGESLYLNGICVASFSWNSLRSQGNRDNSINWTGCIVLPSLSNKYIYGSTPDEVKIKIEKAVTLWFEKALAKAEEK